MSAICNSNSFMVGAINLGVGLCPICDHEYTQLLGWLDFQCMGCGHLYSSEDCIEDWEAKRKAVNIDFDNLELIKINP